MSRIEERVEHFEVAFARDTKRHVDPMGTQRRDNELAAAHEVRRHHLTSNLGSRPLLSRCRPRAEEAFPPAKKQRKIDITPRTVSEFWQKI